MTDLSRIYDPKELRLKAVKLLELAEKTEEYLAAGKPVYDCKFCTCRWSSTKFVSGSTCSMCC